MAVWISTWWIIRHLDTTHSQERCRDGVELCADAGDESGAQEEGGGSLELKPADEMGTLFWDLLTRLLSLMWEPETQNERSVPRALNPLVHALTSLIRGSESADAKH